MVSIGIEEIFAYAFIAYFTRTNCRRIDITKIKQYAEKVADSLRKRGISTCIYYSEIRVKEYFAMYSRWYHLEKDEEVQYVVLNDDIGIEVLNERYSQYPIKSVDEAFRREENVRELF